MTKNQNAAFRGNPPNLDKLAERLKGNLSQWNAVRDTVIEFGAAWKWVHSEATDLWSYRSYLPGDRFFTALTLKDGFFEVSLNLKSEEWDTIATRSPEEQTLLDALKAKALESGDDPAWVHVAVDGDAAFSLLAKLFVARARRVQNPRRKLFKKKKK